ncbi:DNA polymerase beta domain-containing protein [Sporocytophaga myxococcoides]|uniref:DNA polymerase beta domain-containing protein n=1 Tax=Sporocytophaga myxococcoides TaxID=153721 RepID=A0A098LLX6_9BACT|nr:HEPN domain-containing protein [Sporocytophaga myxococcoides]GAL87494.1 DNA polymerase beta domain-containing protein [Sporocytophaga myxococcoides]
MKTSLELLPEHKREELKLITDHIVEQMQPDYVLLFGSYARGNWVEDEYTEDGILYGYKSDYDILVVTETKLDNALSNKWRELEKYVSQLHTTAPVNLIHHSWGYLKRELAHGSYFFIDVVKEGIILYDNGRNIDSPIAVPEFIDPEKVKARAKEEYDLWFESAGEFLIDFNNAFQRESYKKAAFELHQATERYYTALLLVFTGYKEKIHDIEELGSQVEAISADFKNVFPRLTPEQDERFKLLKKAYIDARYKKSYSISKEDLEYLSERVEVLRDLVKTKCEERIRK